MKTGKDEVESAGGSSVGDVRALRNLERSPLPKPNAPSLARDLYCALQAKHARNRQIG